MIEFVSHGARPIPLNHMGKSEPDGAPAETAHLLPPAARLDAPAARRLMVLGGLSSDDAERLADALAGRLRYHGRGRDIVGDNEATRAARLVVQGWAARVQVLADGRRQIIGLLLPGDLIGLQTRSAAFAPTSIVALTAVVSCPAPEPSTPDSGIARALELSAALEVSHLYNQVTRLGRLNAHERISSLLLELNERLTLNGEAVDGRFALPLTQEMVADTLGLTSVHVNRTLQAMRRQGTIRLAGGNVALLRPDVLARSAGFRIGGE